MSHTSPPWIAMDTSDDHFLSSYVIWGRENNHDSVIVARNVQPQDVALICAAPIQFHLLKWLYGQLQEGKSINTPMVLERISTVIEQAEGLK